MGLGLDFIEQPSCACDVLVALFVTVPFPKELLYYFNRYPYFNVRGYGRFRHRHPYHRFLLNRVRSIYPLFNIIHHHMDFNDTVYSISPCSI